MPEKFSCSCEWADCSVFSEQIALHAPDGHPWKSDAYRWRIKTDSGKQCFEKLMLLSTMCHHVPGIAEKVAKGRQSFILARHHFPLSAFDHIGDQKIAVLLSKREIKTLAKNDNSLRLSEECNLVSGMVKSLPDILPKGKLHDAFELVKIQPPKVTIKYVCSPVETSAGVQSEINAWLRVRKHRSPTVSSACDTVSPAPDTTVSAPDSSSVLLPGASVSTKAMARILSSLKKATETASEALSKEPNEPLVTEDSPEPIESEDECVAHVKRKVDAVGLTALTNPKFAKRMNLLCFEYGNFCPIALGNNIGYLYPCSNTDANKSKCQTCRVLKIRSDQK